MRIGPAIAAAVIALAVSFPTKAEVSASWDITGGEAWEGRTGLGVMIGLGGVDCTKDFCNKTWGTKFFGSIEGTFGAFYRVIPNLSFFLDFGLAHMNTDFTEVPEADDGRGFLFQFIGGAAFHAPITGWMDANLGFGIGFVYMKHQTEINQAGSDPTATVATAHKGLDFELRFGADVYLFSGAPTFAVGPYIKLGIPYWAKVCYESTMPDVFIVGDTCSKPDDIEQETSGMRTWHFDDTPLLIHLGLAAKYTF